MFSIKINYGDVSLQKYKQTYNSLDFPNNYLYKEINSI